MSAHPDTIKAALDRDIARIQSQMLNHEEDEFINVQKLEGQRVLVHKGNARGVEGVVKTCVWLPSGTRLFGIKLDQPKGTCNGTYKDGTPYFKCKKGYGIYLKLSSFQPAGTPLKDVDGGVAPKADIHGPTASNDHTWDSVTNDHSGTMGNSYRPAYRAGDYDKEYTSVDAESERWKSQLQAVEAEIMAARGVVSGLQEEQRTLKCENIRHNAARIAVVEQKLNVARHELHTLLQKEKALNAQFMALGDRRAAEDHRKYDHSVGALHRQASALTERRYERNLRIIRPR